MTNGRKNTRPNDATLIPAQVIFHPDALDPPPNKPRYDAEDPYPPAGAKANPAYLKLIKTSLLVRVTPVNDVGGCQN